MYDSKAAPETRISAPTSGIQGAGADVACFSRLICYMIRFDCSERCLSRLRCYQREKERGREREQAIT